MTSLPQSTESTDMARVLREEAGRAGFHRFGIAPVAAWERYPLYRRWLDAGSAGEMDYLVEQAEERRDPRGVLAAARSVVTVGLSYARPEPAAPDGEPRAFIARYARGVDYHMVMKARLQRMARAVADRVGRPVAWTACVDSAPLLEREAAHRGGVGFLAKNTMIIAPGLGSYLLLGELLVDLDATPGEAAEPRCGRCRACLDACPTGAFVDAYHLDARRCISYLTIESRLPIPRELRPALGNMIFGCDRCQEVCPFNAGTPDVPPEPEFAPAAKRDRPALVWLLGLGAAQFRKFVQKSALRRINRAQLMRNVAVALGNTGGPAEVEALGRSLLEPSPLIRMHVAWALGQIAARHPDSGARALLAARLSVEEAAEVREEIALALGPP